jgi:hypothetical protein
VARGRPAAPGDDVGGPQGAHLKLVKVKVNVKAALEKLDEIIPGCISKSPFTYKRTTIAEIVERKY